MFKHGCETQWSNSCGFSTKLFGALRNWPISVTFCLPTNTREPLGPGENDVQGSSPMIQTVNQQLHPRSHVTDPRNEEPWHQISTEWDSCAPRWQFEVRAKMSWPGLFNRSLRTSTETFQCLTSRGTRLTAVAEEPSVVQWCERFHMVYLIYRARGTLWQRS